MDEELPLEDLKARVKKAQKVNESKGEGGLNEHHAYGMAMRFIGDMVSALLVGFAGGWWLDKWLGTKPWFLIVFIFLGLTAGIFNVMRSARQIAEKEARNREEAAEKANSNEG